MEEEDKKAERDLEILKNYQKKEAKSIKKNIYNTFFIRCIDLHSEIFYGVFLNEKTFRDRGYRIMWDNLKQT